MMRFAGYLAALVFCLPALAGQPLAPPGPSGATPGLSGTTPANGAPPPGLVGNTPGQGASCPCWADTTEMADAVATWETEFEGEATCYVREREWSDLVMLVTSFYRPGCTPDNCGALVFVATWQTEYDWRTGEPLGDVWRCGQHDAYNGAPPPSFFLEDLTEGEYLACHDLVDAFAGENACPAEP